ncbi:SGNH/GDSL hydrolase family protein [Niallia sp. Man26]|uniref:SGNH/GDSL hydrolase family protein n=1 Tax=Niallia sp. Man26 TaxID=2912824 RepID=UPI001EDC51F8|nr:SGNH/GDSL hydrolase family protein [Niallia sp. Man26]UPO88345.1 SGNH/GDSL hydrolase family protein [Niallia sp. Man26]
MKNVIKITFLVLILIGLSAIVYGKIQYDNNIKSAGEVAQANYEQYLKDSAEKKEKELADKKAEEKRIYESHKGDTLTYYPMGDSLAEGAFATKEETKYVSVLTDLIEEKLGYVVQLENGAVRSGTGLKNGALPNIQNLIALEPDLVTIQFGNNDYIEKFEDSYSTNEEFKERLEYLIDEIQTNSKSTKIIIVTTWNSGGTSLELDRIINGVGKSKNVEVANIQSVWQYRDDTYGPKGYKVYNGGESDGWHPNDKGHAEIATKIFEKAYELLK